MSVGTIANSSNEVPVGAHNTPAGGATTLATSTPEVRDHVFDSSSERDWCELIRDIVAVANSGGGEIVVRCTTSPRAGEAAGAAENCLSRIEILRRLAEFTGSRFASVEAHAVESTAGTTVVIAIGRALYPIIFNNPGRCPDPANPAEKIELFPAGSYYTRRGVRTEPGTSADIQVFFERLLRQIRRGWLAEIRRVINKPVEAIVSAAYSREGAPSKPKASPPVLKPVRIVTDPHAPALQPQDVDRLYPLRQKDLIRELNRRLGRAVLNSYDIQAVRRQHRLDERPDFVFHLPGAGRRYSPAVADWMLDQQQRDPEFFHKARAADHESMKLRKQKPR
jgi:hypothetical protein